MSICNHISWRGVDGKDTFCTPCGEWVKPPKPSDWIREQAVALRQSDVYDDRTAIEQAILDYLDTHL